MRAWWFDSRKSPAIRGLRRRWSMSTRAHRELVLVATEDLADLDQHRFDRDRGAVVVVGRILRL